MKGDGTWNDVPCTGTRRFVCQFQPGEFDEENLSFNGEFAGEYGSWYEEAEVPEDFPYTFHGNHATYEEAAKICCQEGGFLASIHSLEDNLIAASMLNFEAWIGFSDGGIEGTFAWNDGSEVDYTNWIGGEPNDWGTGEDCTVIKPGGGWNDESCT